MKRKEYAQDCLTHASRVREVLDFSPFTSDPLALSISKFPLFRELGGLLTVVTRAFFQLDLFVFVKGKVQ